VTPWPHLVYIKNEKKKIKIVSDELIEHTAPTNQRL
jgi:hypothetical protein